MTTPAAPAKQTTTLDPYLKLLVERALARTIADNEDVTAELTALRDETIALKDNTTINVDTPR